MKRLILTLLVAITLSAVVSSTATANPLYSTFGPGDIYIDYAAWPIGDFIAFDGTDYGNVILGAAFTPTTEGKLGSVELALVNFDLGVNQFTLNLTTDDGGLPSSTILDSFFFTGIGESPGIYTQQSSLMPYLALNTQYWLVASTDTGNLLGWFLNDIGVESLIAYDSSIEGLDLFTDTAPAFRLNPVPEPSTFLLLGAGLSVLAFFACRRKKE